MTERQFYCQCRVSPDARIIQEARITPAVSGSKVEESEFRNVGSWFPCLGVLKIG